MELDPLQQKAIDDCCDMEKRLVSVTGPAGSGKTTIIREVYNRLTIEGHTVVLAAPTGKAARRIKEATGIEAKTVHKMLEFPRPGEWDEETGEALDVTYPKRDKLYPLDETVIIIDEYAMVSTSLHRDIVDALKRGAVLRVFGDVAQLPPIEQINPATVKDYKTPFQKCLAMKNTIVLENVYRQKEESGIRVAANHVRGGLYPPKGLQGFNIIKTERPVDKLLDLLANIRAGGNKIDFSKPENQIISPGRRSWAGTRALNVALQAFFNPHNQKTLTLPRYKHDNKFPVHVSVGDKVVCTENIYDLRDFGDQYAEWKSEFKPVQSSYIETPPQQSILNGETGIVTSIRDDGSIEIELSDRVVEIPTEVDVWWPAKGRMFKADHRRAIDLAYALTTHKCQGSEYQNIIYVMNKSVFGNLSRKNFYTAITRAKKEAIVISDDRGIQRSLSHAG